MKYHFRNLIFEGGGVKGIAYIGALTVLQQKDILKDIKRVGGASVGAITALLVALDYSVDEIKEVLWSMDLKRFLDSSWGVVRNTERLLTEFGWYKGDYFKNWISGLIEKKVGNENITFGELSKLKQNKQLFLIGTNLSTGFAEIFSHLHTPNMTLVEAVRISMSIPLFFTAVRNKYYEVCVDGGALENYPIKMFDRKKYVENFYQSTNYYNEVNERNIISNYDTYVFNMETLGFRLDSYTEIKIFEGVEAPSSTEIWNFFDYAKRLIATLLDSQQNRHLHSDDWQRTVYIDTLGVKTTDFEISDKIKYDLVEAGRVGTEKYFSWFESSTDKIANRPRSFYDIIS